MGLQCQLQLLLLCFLIAPGKYICQRDSKNPGGSNFRGSAVIQMGDIMLGGLFPVHYPPTEDAKNGCSIKCGKFWELYGMHRIEAFLYILDEINSNPNILPNISLGANLRDSCWFSPKALQQSVDFVKSSIATQNGESNKEVCANEEPSDAIATLIGPGSSLMTAQVQRLLSLFAIPQIGYSATSNALSDKMQYNYFLRVAPSDALQAQALVDIIQKFNWTYVSIIQSADYYGQTSEEAFQKKLSDGGRTCVATRYRIHENAESGEYDKVISSLLRTRARVVICFCKGSTITKLFEAARRRNLEGRFLFIGSDSWTDRPDVIDDNKPQAVGGMLIRMSSPQTTWFNKHWLSLKPETNRRNPWFKGFWQEKFECYLNGSDRDPRYDTPCTGNEDLSEDFQPDTKIGHLTNAIYTAAYALHEMNQDLCSDTPGDLCPAMFPINGNTFMKYLKNVSFTTYSGDNLFFDGNGEPPGRYDILNYQSVPGEDGTETYDYIKVGSWNNGDLTMDIDKIYWPENGRGEVIESVCSQPCPEGHVKIYVVQSGNQCCWICMRCRENEIVLDEFTCQPTQ